MVLDLVNRGMTYIGGRDRCYRPIVYLQFNVIF